MPAPAAGDATAAIESAAALDAAGRAEEALAYCEAALALAPGRADALHLRAILASRLGADDEAEAWLERALAAAPDAPELHNSLAAVLCNLGRFDAAAASAERALALAPALPEARINLGRARYGQGEVRAAVAAWRRALALGGDAAEAHAALGTALFEEGRDADAAAHLGRAAGDARFGWAAACRLGDAYTASVAGAASPGAFGAAPPVAGDWPAPGGGAVVMTCCDAAYLDAYAAPLARALDRAAPGGALHLHLVNALPGKRTALDSLAGSLGATDLSVTWETAPGAGPTYFASIRFVRLAQLLEASARPVLALDADSLVRTPLGPALAALAGSDLALALRPELPFLNRKVLATSVHVRATNAAARFLRRLAAYLLACMRDGRTPWYLDQCAFAVVLAMSGRAGDAPEVAPLPRGLADFGFAPGSAVWSAKGGRKEDALFRAEAERLTRP